MTPKKQEEILLSKGWEHVMTEADGCDTWTYPHLLRRGWPEWAKKLHGTQCYWDRDEAMELQREIDGPDVKVDRYQLQHGFLLEECTRFRRGLNLPIPQWEEMSDTERVRWTLKVLAEQLQAAERQVTENYRGYRQIIDLLKRSRMKHGLCKPRSRKACTACNAKEELEEILAADKGSVVRAV